MKTLFFFSIFFLAGGVAKAEGADSGNFAPTYSLNTFQINTDSSLLNGIGTVDSGLIEINETAQQLRLTLKRSIHCKGGMMCKLTGPGPTVLTLPVILARTDACLGTEIIAEQDLRPADGELQRIVVRDLNGISCGNSDATTFKSRITVTVTEQGPRSETDIVSVLSGFPIIRAE